MPNIYAKTTLNITILLYVRHSAISEYFAKSVKHKFVSAKKPISKANLNCTRYPFNSIIFVWLTQPELITAKNLIIKQSRLGFLTSYASNRRPTEFSKSFSSETLIAMIQKNDIIFPLLSNYTCRRFC